MSYNLTEQARKDAGLPGFVRGVPTSSGGRRNVTGDMFARFKEAVDKRVGFMMDELTECRSGRDKLRDEIAKLTQANFDLSAKDFLVQASSRVKRTAESIDLPVDDVKRLANAVESVS